MLKVIASGGRDRAYKGFRTAFYDTKANDFLVLLVDSESPVAKGDSAWVHLHKQDGWNKPEQAGCDNVHLMVQCMEAWFFADKDALERIHDDKFIRNALPAREKIEDIPKNDLIDGLKNATRQCKPEKQYDKGMRSFEILSQIDPQKVIAASPHAKRLIDTLKQIART